MNFQIEKFVTDNIRKLRVLFQPETKIAQDGSRTRTMITGAYTAQRIFSTGEKWSLSQ